MYRVLVPSHSLSQAEEYHHLLTQGQYRDIAFRYPANLTRHTSTLSQLCKQCQDVMQEEDIDAVLPLCPEYSLLLAHLKEDAPEILAPSIESVFLCMHRFYSKRHVLQGFNSQHQAYEFEEIENGIVTCDLEDVGGQGILKDAYAIDDTLTKRIKSTRQLWKDMQQIKLKLENSIEFIKCLLKDKINMDKYPLAFEPTCVLESQVPSDRGLVTLHYVEACVVNDTLIPWVISDIFHFKEKPCFNISYVCIPSRLDDAMQYHIWAIFREITQHLINAAFNNHFLHAKIAVYKSGDVRVLDILPCLIHQNTALYRHVYHGGDNIQGHIDLALGRTVWTPKLKPVRCAMRARYHAKVKEVNLDDLLDVKAAKANPNVWLLQHDHHLTNNGLTFENGLPIVEIQAMESSYESCHAKVKEISGEVLKLKPNPDQPQNEIKKEKLHNKTLVKPCPSASPESESSKLTYDSQSVTSGFTEESFPDETESVQRSCSGYASPQVTELMVPDQLSDSGHSGDSRASKKSDLTLGYAARSTDDFKIRVESPCSLSSLSRQSDASSPETGSVTGPVLLDPDSALFRLGQRRGSNVSTASDNVTSLWKTPKGKPGTRRFSHI